MGNVIPRLLPSSTLACAPSNAMLKQFSVTVETNREQPIVNEDLNNANQQDTKYVPNTERVVNEKKDKNNRFDKIEKIVPDKNNNNRPNTMRDTSYENKKDENLDKNEKDKDKDKGMRTLAMSV